MTDPTRMLEGLLDPEAAATPRFPPTSRYAGIEITLLTESDGTQVPYLRRRFVPPPDRFALIREYSVTQADRLDRIAAVQVGDPEMFWRICDANGAMRPDDLVERVGRRLRITLPEGLPGAGDD